MVLIFVRLHFVFAAFESQPVMLKNLESEVKKMASSKIKVFSVKPVQHQIQIVFRADMKKGEIDEFLKNLNKMRYFNEILVQSTKQISKQNQELVLICNLKKNYAIFGRSFVDNLKNEITRIEAAFTPKKGTSVDKVTKVFGKGRPTEPEIIKRRSVPKDSKHWLYNLKTGGMLYVCYDQNWKVVWAYYIDPFEKKKNEKKVSLEEEYRFLNRRLNHLKSVKDTYGVILR
jgi:hypothetical protein